MNFNESSNLDFYIVQSKKRKDQFWVLEMTRFVVEICGSETVQNEHSSLILNKRSLTNANAMMVDDVPQLSISTPSNPFIFFYAFFIHIIP